MPDVIRYTEDGREFAVCGVRTKAESIRAAASAVHEVIGEWTTTGETALEEWRGPHPATMVDLHATAADEVVGLYSDLSVTAMRIGSFPGSFTPSGMIGSAFTATRSAAGLRASAPDGAVGAVPEDLRAFAATVRGSADTFATRAAAVSYDGLRAEVTTNRPLTPEERQARVDAGADPATLDDVTIPVTRDHPVEELITLVAPTDRAGTARTRAAWIADEAGTNVDFLPDEVQSWVERP